MYVLDSSAWIEYFIGSPRGMKIRQIVDNKANTIATPLIVLVELSCRHRRDDIDFIEQLDFIRLHSSILGMNDDVVVPAGNLYRIMRRKNDKASIADAVIAASAQANHATIVTCDSDFTGVENIVHITG